MAKAWSELIVWRLEGERFEEGGRVDLRDLQRLVHLRDLLIEGARGIWMERHGQPPPGGTASEVDIRVRSIEAGSVQFVVDIARPPPPLQASIFPTLEGAEEFVECVHDAAAGIHDVVESVAAGRALPSWMNSRGAMAAASLARGMRPEEHVSVSAARAKRPQAAARLPERVRLSTQEEVRSAPTSSVMERPVVRFDSALATKLGQIADGMKKAHEEASLTEEQRTLSGEVRMVDLDQKHAELRPDGADGRVTISFEPDQEQQVTKAISEHRELRLRVRGKAKLNQRGKMVSFHADRVAILSIPDSNAPSEELFLRLASEDPARLMAFVVSTTLRPGLVARAAELAGEALPAEVVAPALLGLLQHGTAVVREGALYGLRSHLGGDVLGPVAELAERDPNPGIRAVAASLVREAAVRKEAGDGGGDGG